jgi:hypothetical protein
MSHSKYKAFRDAVEINLPPKIMSKAAFFGLSGGQKADIRSLSLLDTESL